jgi:glycosyltransferase involved in cell wall biosynthesis
MIYCRILYKDNIISVVVPAYNEELLIEQTLKSIPAYIDKVYAIDDGSYDKTYDIMKKISNNDSRIFPIKHKINKGVGAAIVTGYKQSVNDNIDITVVMAGDHQMDHTRIPELIEPIIEGTADYTKGNRLTKTSDMKGMSIWRRSGNSILTLLTKISSGYYDIADPQNGYAAISKKALTTIKLDEIYPKYGYCNDILVKLNIFNLRVKDVPIPARYGSEKSKIKYGSYIMKVSFLLLGNFLYRLKMKYIYQGLSPIPLLFAFGALFMPLSLISILDSDFQLFSKAMSLPVVLSGILSILIAIMLDVQNSRYISSYNK